MVSGFVLRNGERGSDDLIISGRSTIRPGAVRFYNVSLSQSGPPVSTTYPLGRYMEDNVFLGDLGSFRGAISTWTNITAAIVLPWNFRTALMLIS